MAQIAGFDSSFVPTAPTEGLRQRDDAPDSSRVTPPAEGDAQQPDRQRAAPEDSTAETQGRIAFTTKFGPDETGSPLQLVRGDAVIAAETLDLGALQQARQTQASRNVLLRAQETEQRLTEKRSENAAAQIQIQQPDRGPADGGAPTGVRTDGPGTDAPQNSAPETRAPETSATFTPLANTPDATPPGANTASANTASGGQSDTSGGGRPTESRPGAVVDLQI